MKRAELPKDETDLRTSIPSGVAVIYRNDQGLDEETRTTSIPWTLADGTRVQRVEGRRGAVLESRIRLRPATDVERPTPPPTEERSDLGGRPSLVEPSENGPRDGLGFPATRGGRRPRAARGHRVAVPIIALAGLVTVSALGAVAAVLLLLVLLEPPSTYCPDCAAVRERNAAIRWYFESGQARREFPGLGDYVPDLEGFPMPEGEDE